MGRDPIPVQRYVHGDQNRSCASLRAEIQANAVEAQNKFGLDNDKFWKNAAWAIIVTPLLMDVKEADKKEAEALIQRNQSLRQLLIEKGCED